jgi:ADP-heptose:LPS heptosyltransferase
MNEQHLKLAWWTIAFSHLDWLASRRRGATDERKVLIVRLDGIGDFALWLGAARELRALYPRERYQLTLLGNQLWTSLANEEPAFDRVWKMDLNRFGRDLRYRFRLLKAIAMEGFSTAINPTFARDFLWGDAVVRASGAPRRVGVDGSTRRMSAAGKMLSDRWYTELIPVDNPLGSEIEINAAIMRGLGMGSFVATGPRTLVKHAPPATLNGVDYYVLSPVAGIPSKCWPLENFRELARMIHAETGWLGVICGGRRDRGSGRRLAQTAGVPLADYTGKVSLPETVALLAGSRFVVANDTGVTHLAAATGTPSVCILGGAHYGRFLPYPALRDKNFSPPQPVIHKMDCFGCDWRCIYKVAADAPFPCIANVSVDSVWQVTRSILEQIRSSDNRGEPGRRSRIRAAGSVPQP